MSKATEIADRIVKALIYDVVLKGVAAAAVAEAPWLSLPVINQVFMFTLNRMADKIYRELDRTVAFQVIEVETDRQSDAYKKAVDALRAEITKPEEMQDAEAVARAKEEFKKRLATLIHLRP